MTWLELVKEYFPGVDNETADYILWEHTGFPGFWNIPKDGNNSEECCRKQLKEYLETVNAYQHYLEVKDEKD